MDVHHATLGIVGMGRIGEAVARRASLGFAMNVLYSGRSRKPAAEQTYGAQHRTLDELLEQADFVVVLAPFTPETARMIRAEHFARMKPTAVFVNASRGQLVDEEALVEALRSGAFSRRGWTSTRPSRRVRVIRCWRCRTSSRFRISARRRRRPATTWR